MANQLKPASTFGALRTPIMDPKTGAMSWEWVKWFQDAQQKLQNGLNQLGQLIGEINAATIIEGRTEGIGTTVGHIDDTGAALGPMVDFSRPYLNKTTDHIADGTGNPLAGGVVAHQALTASTPAAGDYLRFDGTDWVPAALPSFPGDLPVSTNFYVDGYNSATGSFHSSQPAFSNLGGQLAEAQLPASGLTVVITTAPLTVGGTTGSMTFHNGILTAQTPAT